LVVAGMLGGYVTGRVTKKRPLAGVVLAAAGVAAGMRWYRNSGPGTSALLSTIYIGAFGASHPLATKIARWPSVLATSAAAARPVWVLYDHRCSLSTAKPGWKSA